MRKKKIDVLENMRMFLFQLFFTSSIYVVVFGVMFNKIVVKYEKQYQECIKGVPLVKDTIIITKIKQFEK